jgi:hypothetical protein
MREFLKRLFCSHWWDEGTPLKPDRPFDMRRFTCDKCGAQKVRLWDWGSSKNIAKRIN